MSQLERIASERLRSIPRYRPGKAAPTVDGKLSSNESAFGPSPQVRAAVHATVDELHRYETGDATLERISSSLGVKPSELILTNGSDELCFLVATVFLSPVGQRVVTSRPGYAINGVVSTLAGADITHVDTVDGRHDLEGLARASQGARLLWLPTPHNPTGTHVTRHELVRMIEMVEPTCLIVLDEAYRGFVEGGQTLDTLALVRQYPHVLIQRTLSKDHGLAGLRLGFGIASEGIISALKAVRGPFTVNAAALAAADAAMKSEPWRLMVTETAIRERQRLEDLLTELGIGHYPSQANFVSVKIPWNELSAHLGPLGISIRQGEDLAMPGWCRISVGLPAQMALVRQGIRAWAGRRAGQ